MNGIVSTALMGFFVLSNVGAVTSTPFSAGQTPSVPTESPQSYQVAMTGYNAVPDQTDSSPYTTASGAYSDPEVVAARSQDLAQELPFGTIIEVSSATSSPTCGWNSVQDLVGYRVIADVMNVSKHDMVDILFNASPMSFGTRDLNPALVLGVCKNVTVTVVGRVDISQMPKTQTELATLIGKDDLAIAN